MKRLTKKDCLIVVPLAVAAIHLALLCLAVFPMINYAKTVSPPWTEPLLPLLKFLVWPFFLLGGNPFTLWIGIALSFLWMPLIAFVVVKIGLMLSRKDPEKGAVPLSLESGSVRHTGWSKTDNGPELIELVDKFAREWHLSVPERRALPEDGIPADLLVSRISAILQANGRYPFDWKPADGFDGGLIVREGATFRIYWKVEAGVSKFELKEIQEFSDSDHASRVWAKRFFGSGFDGIKICWNR